ncbi:Fumarylacetoacetase [Ceratocystis lukuohia]|uniref:Fumarylacetoacetase n=1 Tax=Ceratocystis lukuohia TaxID=2019550 RepID=A0ABR4MS49_9PEZI
MPLASWIEIDAQSGFSLENLPFGIFNTKSDPRPRVGVAVGQNVLDMAQLTTHPAFAQTFPMLQGLDDVFRASSLNAFAALGRRTHCAVRERLQDVLRADTPYAGFLRDNAEFQTRVLLARDQAVLQLPVEIGDYTDFFAGYHHALHTGTMFRGKADALQRNYLHLPVAYHGRASSVVVSGTPVQRPMGQILETAPGAVGSAMPAAGMGVVATTPVTGLSRRLDFELELGCIIATGNKLGESIPVDKAEEHIFGYVLLNDWSARDIQAWEYVPLGPFNGKNFATSISGWVVLADALEPFRTEPLAIQGKGSQEYLQEANPRSVFDISLEVVLEVKNKAESGGNEASSSETPITRVSSKNLMWSFPQMIAHHTLGGCPLRTGDLLGSGTISGETEDSRGSLLELSEAGKKDVVMSDGSVRRFLEQGDTVTMRGVCVGADGARVGFGDCYGHIVN